MKNFLLILSLGFLTFSCQRPEANKLIDTKVETYPVKSAISEPIFNALIRITKKPFGLRVSPKNSPVSPEKFTGFHNAVDFEILAGEENSPVDIYAICKGKIVFKESVSGYGGVVVEECEINRQIVTVIYGHINLSETVKKVNDTLESGEKFAVLGRGFTKETGGERKHLHLGIHKGSKLDIRGYVQTESELSDWIDYRDIVQ
jgi:murein DD-endopeptidase MepM/ murein hydrolase activator NlpD